MNLIINGDERQLTSQTLSTLIQELGMKSDRVAIELNHEIVHKDQWPQTQLKEGDRLEIVHFVGGGSGNRAIGSSRHRVIGASGRKI